MSKRRCAVLGLGQFGRALSRELTRCGVEVLAVDASAKRVETVRDEVAHAAIADIRDKNALKELFTSHFDVAIVAIGGSLEAAIMSTLYLKDMDVGEIWVEANTNERAEVLRRIGAARILSPEREMGRRIAQRLANPNLLEFLPLTTGYGVVDAAAPTWTHGKTLAELDLRKRFQLAVIAIRRGDATVIAPGGDARLGPDDNITIVGRDADLARFRDTK